MKTQAIVFESASRVAIRSVELPALQDDHVLIRTLYSTISPGTELRTLSGREASASPFPLVPGYSTVGRVLECGKRVKGLEVGGLAALRGGLPLSDGLGSSWGGHAQHLIVPEQEVFLLPDGVNPQHATLTTLLATAMHGTDLARVRIREQVAVVGLGLVGQLCARLLHYSGANVVATDLIDHRRDVAQRAGLRVVPPGDDLRDAFSACFPFGAEAVVDATGSSKVMKSSLQLLREKPRQDPCGAAEDEAAHSQMSMCERLREHAHLHNEWHGPRLIAQGSYADPMQINYYDLFNNEVKLVVPRVHELKDMFRATELLADPRFNLDGLLIETLPITDATKSYRRLAENPKDMITICFAWDQ